MPHERKLSGIFKEKATSLLRMRANKKMVQQELCSDTGNIVLLKDLSNLTSAAKNVTSKNDLDNVVKLLKDTYGKFVSKIS